MASRNSLLNVKSVATIAVIAVAANVLVAKVAMSRKG